MIELLVRLLRPLFVPLLKLQLNAPHLPEGSSLVRALKPSEAWLTYRYLATLFGMLGTLIGAGVGMVLLVAELGGTGLVLAALAGLVELAVVGFALVATRVDYELRHYLVGDRSLRVSLGALTRKEVTLSYANVQNLEVTQGPLQRLFGFKALTVITAGADLATAQKGESLHVVSMVGLENADELRELILGMLRQHKDSGLGEVVQAPVGAGVNLGLLTQVRDAAVLLREAARPAP